MSERGDEVEVEWQFDAIDLRPVERWLADSSRRGEDVGAFEVAAGEIRRQVDQYLDTEDWRIGRAGLTLRIRQTGRGEEITLKDRGSLSAGGLRRRLEVTETLSGDGTVMGRTGPVGRRIAAVAAQRPLRQILEVRTRRQPYLVSLEGTPVAEVALDDTVIGTEGDDQPARLRRVEIEANPGAEVEVEPLVTALQRACGLQPALLSKFEAGLLSLGLEIPGPPDLGSTEVTPEASMGELARAVVRRHLGAMLAHEAGTRLGEDIEELHDMRVATRRLRAALALFGDVLPPEAGALREELRWLAQVLGRVRDLDVQLERFTDMAQHPDGHPPVGHPLHELSDLLQDERSSAREELLEALESVRWEQLVERLLAITVDDVEPGGPGAVPALLVVPPLVLSRHRAATRAANRASRTGKAADFHRLRIRCKWLRYCLEFTTGLYGGQTERFIRRVARLQDALGMLQDAEVAIDRLAALAERDGVRLPPRTVFAMGEMAERYRVEGARLLVQLPERVRVLGHKDWVDVAKLMERRRTLEIAATPVGRAPEPPVEQALGVVGQVAEAPLEQVPDQGLAAAAPCTTATVAFAHNGHASDHRDHDRARRTHLPPPPGFVPASGAGPSTSAPAGNGSADPADTSTGGWPEVSWGLPASG